MILLRSILKEITLTTAAAVIILLLIFLSQFLVRYMKYAASGRIAADAIFVIICSEIPRLLGILLPLAVYVGVIMALGRLRVDRELLIMRISGFTRRVWAWPYAGFLVTMSLLVFVVVGWLAPWAGVKRVLYTEKTEEQRLLSVLSPGRFQVLGEGKQVVFVQQLSKRHDQARGIFIAETNKAKTSMTQSIVTAKNANFKRHPEYQNAPYFEMNDGRRYEGIIGAADYRILRFDRYGFRLQERGVQLPVHDKDTLAFPQLWRQKTENVKLAELNWRLAMPLSVLVLGVIALVFCGERFRWERYVTLLVALMFYFVYMNGLLLAREWLERGKLWVMWVMHGVPIAVLCLSLFFMYAMSKRHDAA